MTFREALVSQSKINSHMKQNFSFSFEKWGIHVERIELQSITPKRTSGTSAQMVMDMITMMQMHCCGHFTLDRP